MPARPARRGGYLPRGGGLGTEVSIESLGEERHVPGSTVAVKPAPGAVFAMLDD